MGFRFRKSIKIIPGVRINISKKGVSSISIGKRGATLNVGESGTRATIGIPGTGLSYSEKTSHAHHDKPEQLSEPPNPSMAPLDVPSTSGIERLKTWLIIGLVLVIVVILMK